MLLFAVSSSHKGYQVVCLLQLSPHHQTTCNFGELSTTTCRSLMPKSMYQFTTSTVALADVLYAGMRLTILSTILPKPPTTCWKDGQKNHMMLLPKCSPWLNSLWSYQDYQKLRMELVRFHIRCNETQLRFILTPNSGNAETLTTASSILPQVYLNLFITIHKSSNGAVGQVHIARCGSSYSYQWNS